MILKLLSYNIRHGGIGREGAIAAAVRDAQPDLVVLQEATRPAVVARIAAIAGMTQWETRSGQSLGFMSRTPVAHVSWHRPRVSRHAFIEIVPAGTAWRVFGVHLSAVHAAWTEHRRVYELRALLKAIGRRQPGPHVLMGDFNTLAPGELLDVRKLPARLKAMVWLSGGRIRWRTIATILEANYVDAFRTSHPNLIGSTFPTWDPHLRLDYLFVPDAHADHVVTCQVLDSATVRTGSDHLPLFAELDV